MFQRKPLNDLSAVDYQHIEADILAFWVDFVGFEGWLNSRIVNESPLFEERMDSHNSIYISRQMPSTSGSGKIYRGIHPIEMDHEISVFFVNLWCFTRIFVREEFGE